MTTLTFKAQTREKGIKNASKKAFRNNQIVGVIYNHKENLPIQFDRHDFEKLVPKMKSNTLLKVNLGKSEKVTFVKDYSFFLNNHRIQHVDFQEIVPGKSVKIRVPIEYVGNPVGVSKGGFIQVLSRSILIECDSQKIPENITIDISHLDVNQRIYLKDAPQLKGIKYLQSPDLALIGVLISSRKRSEGGAETSTSKIAANDKESAEEKK